VSHPVPSGICGRQRAPENEVTKRRGVMPNFLRFAATCPKRTETCGARKFAAPALREPSAPFSQWEGDGMFGESYRVHAETLGIISKDNDRTMVMIPVGAILTVVDGPLNGNRVADVLWKNDKIMIFTQDLRDRGKLIESTAASE